ncbi:MAG: acyl-CoA synthetase (AMP-forming)/AMP-acid ligase II, partial [Planctomycetota bacterium]
MITANIASHLPAMALSQAEMLAVVIQSKDKNFPRYSYRELDEASDIFSRGLQEIGIGKGTRTVLMVRPGLEFFALVFALFKLGAVLIAVDPGMGTKNLGKCLQEAEAEAFIGIREAHIARIVHSWAKATLRINVVLEPWKMLGLLMTDLSTLSRLGKVSKMPVMNSVVANDAAAILFTSGSTGVPKGVNYTHGNFTAQVKALQDLYDIKPGEVDLATFPLFALFAPAMGMTSIIPDMDFTQPGNVDPVGIFSAVNDFKATTMFGSPALLNRVSRWGVDNGKRMPTLKRVISAGAPVSPAVIKRFSHLLESDAEIFTPYGATEALPVTSIGSKEVLQDTGRQTGEGRGVCVGKPVSDMVIKIIAITDEAIGKWQDVHLLDTNQVGEIVVRGPQVSSSYYNREESNNLAKIKNAYGNLYHRMGDLGYFDEQGRL